MCGCGAEPEVGSTRLRVKGGDWLKLWPAVVEFPITTSNGETVPNGNVGAGAVGKDTWLHS